MRYIILSLLVVGRQLVNAQRDFYVTGEGYSDSTWNQSDWSLSTTMFGPAHYQTRMSLSNGYVGASLAAAGPFFEYDLNLTNPDGDEPANVWPLFSRRLSFTTISGFYNIQPNASGTNYPWLNQYGWESFIAGIPHSTALLFTFDNQTLDAAVDNETISNFHSSISFKTGVGRWSYTWNPSASSSFNISYEALFSRQFPNLIAVKAEITPSMNASGTITDFLDGRSAVRSYLAEKRYDYDSMSIMSSVHPDGLANITAVLISSIQVPDDITDPTTGRETTESVLCYATQNSTSIGQTYDINLKAGETATFFKYVGVASNDKFSDPERTAREASETAKEAGWNGILQQHEQAWSRIMTEAAVDNYTDPETGMLPDDPFIRSMQIASVANTYYLMQELQPDGSGLNDNSLSVGGLGSESYAGMIFWDADYWDAPGINLNFPTYAKQISNFRLKQYPQSLANAKFNNYTEGSVLYSWTAGRYGNCTGTGPCVDYEYHLNYDIVFNLIQQYNITQNDTWFENGPRQLIESVALMAGELINYNETTDSYWIRNMTDPDEYANHIDNGAFTVASAEVALQIANDLRRKYGLATNETWEQIASKMEFPVADSQITLEFQTMNDSVEVKQADVVLLAYPLDYEGNNYTVSNKLLDLDYYAHKQSPDGPAMTYSIFAIAANALSPSGCSAYTYALNAQLPYLRQPWYLFCEQNDDNVFTNGNQNPAFPFLTGHGGANQIAPFGFLGLRTDQPRLYINPSLPPQIPHLRLRDIYYGGAGLKTIMNRTHTTLTRFSTADIPGLTDIYANRSMPIVVGQPGSEELTTYNISMNSTIYIPNRLYFENLTQPGNLLQCRPVVSNDTWVPGQFPHAAIDGAISTSWQPKSNESASILVNITGTPYQRVQSVLFNWGERPAKNATVFFSNSTLSETANSYDVPDSATKVDVEIGISDPYDAEEAARAKVVPFVGNETSFAIVGRDVWTGDYVKLVVDGVFDTGGEEAEQDGGATVAEFVVVGEKQGNVVGGGRVV
ncbi:carbohydrate-binding module family 32 protein [Sporormia fimetaria CBS 119925]|uniref:alpha,alpha-trehalase n=1 Tax=Sporormia fimetaria CBS 119925 TaxID=1340428 RepID=A0A6A6V8Y6_9PLEO|nr:carbohydrate-binding module family 32 protein [Sporormia fimetaria CBS 119925]